uniref:Uncharacterized protein n=1 Tax=Vespula pensylvanica TaxID=30213 RepID=A0A834JWT9_VESPE|nr:hypothetical protein H0235_016944 [Vespula pensylvanica]
MTLPISSSTYPAYSLRRFPRVLSQSRRNGKLVLWSLTKQDPGFVRARTKRLPTTIWRFEVYATTYTITEVEDALTRESPSSRKELCALIFL